MTVTTYFGRRTHWPGSTRAREPIRRPAKRTEGSRQAMGAGACPRIAVTVVQPVGRLHGSSRGPCRGIRLFCGRLRRARPPGARPQARRTRHGRSRRARRPCVSAGAGHSRRSAGRPLAMIRHERPRRLYEIQFLTSNARLPGSGSAFPTPAAGPKARACLPPHRQAAGIVSAVAALVRRLARSGPWGHTHPQAASGPHGSFERARSFP